MQRNNDNKDDDIKKEIDIPNFVKRDWDIPERLNDEDEDSGTFIKELNSSLAKQVNDDFKDIDYTSKNQVSKKKKTYKALKIAIFSLLSIASICCLLLFTKGGQKIVLNMAGDYIYNKLDYQASEDVQEVDGSGIKALPDTTVKSESHIINILLIGVEQFEHAQNTDSMIIATMNTKDHSLKLTSLMRDLYVQIPGYKDNRLNSPYGVGGIELLYDTIELNFGIRMDGYVLVNFDAFEKIVDMVGGVNIKLTEKEAQYLNTHNYISNPKYRKVVEGVQLMNGNQVLGYCRVRKVSTGTENDDFGRTQRQRIVLNAIFDKLKSKNVIEMVLLMNDILNNIPIVTDIKATDFKKYLEEAVNLKVHEIENHRIPSDGSFENLKVRLGKSTRKQEVLQPKDWDETRDELHKYIYGDMTEADK